MGAPFLHLLNSVVSYAPLSGRTNDGDPTYGAIVALAAYVDSETKLLRNGAGEEVVSTTVIVTQTAIPAQSLVWVPGQNTADQNVARVPITISESPHPNATYALTETRL